MHKVLLMCIKLTKILLDAHFAKSSRTVAYIRSIACIQNIIILMYAYLLDSGRVMCG